jgi:hypothetical protein
LILVVLDIYISILNLFFTFLSFNVEREEKVIEKGKDKGFDLSYFDDKKANHGIDGFILNINIQ